MNIYELDLTEVEKYDPAKVQRDFAQSYAEFHLNKPAGWIKPKNFDFELLYSISPSKEVFIKATLKGFNIFTFSKLKLDEALNFFKIKGFSEPRKLLSFDEIPIEGKTQNSIVDFASSIGWDGVIIFCAHDGYPLYVINSNAND